MAEEEKRERREISAMRKGVGEGENGGVKGRKKERKREEMCVTNTSVLCT